MQIQKLEAPNGKRSMGGSKPGWQSFIAPGKAQHPAAKMSSLEACRVACTGALDFALRT